MILDGLSRRIWNAFRLSLKNFMDNHGHSGSIGEFCVIPTAGGICADQYLPHKNPA